MSMGEVLVTTLGFPVEVASLVSQHESQGSSYVNSMHIATVSETVIWVLIQHLFSSPFR